jgi:NADH-quinone oxidoreductase subunit C
MNAADIHARLSSHFGSRVLAFDDKALDPGVLVDARAIAEVAAFAMADGDLRFDNLMCLSAVDYPKETPPCFEVVYHLFSYCHQHTFVLKARVSRESPRLPSVEGVWPVANWHEREAYDLMGIVFDGHSDLRRILLPDDWQGHPLRRDWQDPEFYNGMRVKPTAQMAERAQAGELIGVGPFEFTPPNPLVEEA